MSAQLNTTNTEPWKSFHPALKQGRLLLSSLNFSLGYTQSPDFHPDRPAHTRTVYTHAHTHTPTHTHRHTQPDTRECMAVY